MLERMKQSPRYRWLVVAAVSIGTFMATLDGNIVNVALPAIATDFHATLALLQWVVTAYLLTISSLLPVFGRTADLLGRKNIFALGYIIFTVGSALCGFATGLWFLVAARVLQAVGASMLMANSMAIVSSVFPPKERGRALGVTGTVVALGSLTGPAIGGLLIGWAGWRSAFFINVPIGILGVLAAMLILPSERPVRGGDRFDFGGAVLFTTGIVGTLFGISNGSELGWTSLPVVVSLLAGLSLLAGFVVLERRVAHPLIDLGLFRIRAFLFGNLSGYLSFVAMFCNTMLLPFYLQLILGWTPEQAGMLLMVQPMMMAVVAPASGRAADRLGAVRLSSAGLCLMACSLLYYALLPGHATLLRILPGPLLMGLGTGLFQSPNNTSVMNAVPPRQMGIAGSINGLVRNLGMVTGIAFSVSLFGLLGGSTVPAAGQAPVFLHAYRYVMLAAMAIALGGMAVSLKRTGAVPSNPAQPEAPALGE